MSFTVHDPFALFDQWLADAVHSEPNDPNAMSLATVDADGTLSNRIVLLKGHDAQGFRFFTNYDSRKGQALSNNPRAAALFHWKTLERQVRIEGPVEPLDPAQSQAYYDTRPRGSRIGKMMRWMKRSRAVRPSSAGTARPAPSSMSNGMPLAAIACMNWSDASGANPISNRSNVARLRPRRSR